MSDDAFSQENALFKKISETIYFRNHRGEWQELTWQCHICGKERSDRYISVFRRQLSPPLNTHQENIRYCNDNQDCVEKAKIFSFMIKENS